MESVLRQIPEREVKLKTGHVFRLPHFPGEPLSPRLFTSTYFDTVDFRLARLEATLRRKIEHRSGRSSSDSGLDGAGQERCFHENGPNSKNAVVRSLPYEKAPSPLVGEGWGEGGMSKHGHPNAPGAMTPR